MFEKSRNVKRIVSVSAAALCMIASLRIAPYSVVETNAAGDMLTAFEITEEMQIGWNLGNTLDATVTQRDPETKEEFYVEHATVASETAWGQPKATPELFDAIQAKGFNTVRVPTTWFQHLDENGKIDQEWMDRVKEVVNYGIDRDMYIILNLHHENWVNRADLGTAYDEMHDMLINLWTQINEEFGDYDQHLIFECMNEPRAAGTDHEWWGPKDDEVETINKLNADFVDLIRSSDSPYAKTRLLMIPGYCAGSDVSMISLIDVPEDEYVAVSVHAYVPYNFTMNPGKDGQHDTFTTAFSNELASILDGIRQTFLDKDIPVVIGEFGTSNYENTEARIQWADQYLTTTKKYGIPCVLWDNNVELETKPTGEAHGYINRRTLEWYEEPVKVVEKMMEIINDDTIVWGSERHIPKLTHQDLSEGVLFYTGPTEIDASKEDTYENTTPGGDGEVTWDQLEGKEVAIKFTGATPVLCFSDENYGGWTEVKAYEVDEENGIAYYLMDSAAKAWGDDPTEIAHMQAKTLKVTVVEAMYILDAPEGEVELPPETAEIHKIKFTDIDRSSSLEFTIEGAPGTKTNDCLGFMNGDDWDQIEWSGTLDADGKLIVTIDMSKVPEETQAGEFQIWGNFDIVDMTGYKVVGEGGEVDDVVWGDADGDGLVKMNDVVLILQSIADADRYGVDGTDKTHITAEGMFRADVFEHDGGDLTGQDALLIQQYLLKQVDTLVPAK